MTNVLSILDYGAVADGKTDCTEAIQNALNDAHKVQGEVFVPSGTFLCGKLKMPELTTIKGCSSWGYRYDGGSVLMLNDENADCLLDITGAFGCNISNICFNGNGNLGENIHGIYLKKENPFCFGRKEDTPSIENCRISNFSGNGGHFENVWCFSIRHSQFGFNTGNGFYMNGCDGFIIDNWFSDNKKSGFFCDKAVASLSLTGNRFECNGFAGFEGKSGSFISFSGNYFDYNDGPGLYLSDEGEFRVNITACCNIFHSSGKSSTATKLSNPYFSSHIYIERCANIVVQGNVFNAEAVEIDGKKVAYPDYAITYKKLKSAVIKDNTLQNAAGKEILVDLGQHEDDVIVKDNTGTIVTDYRKLWPIFEGHLEEYK